MYEEYHGYWLKKGTILSERYEILDIIGEGGMGNVYLSKDTLLDSLVSIKEYFPRRLATRVDGKTQVHICMGESQKIFETGLDKFINEARLLAKYEHLEGIVMVKDFFYANNTAYMVTKYIEGEDIKSHIEKHGPMDPEQVLFIMKPILKSLSILHKEKLIHRDIAPDNILLRNDGHGVLIDFGAARFSTIYENKTMTVYFKRGYSAEEQYAKKAKRGAYTDVYGACATMYFMLTGQKPEESIRRLLNDQVIPLTKFHDIPMHSWQKKAIMKGMAIKASNRYQNMELLCEDLYAEKKPFPIKKLTIGGIGVIALIITLVLAFSQNQKTNNIKPDVHSGAETAMPSPTATMEVKTQINDTASSSKTEPPKAPKTAEPVN